MIRINKIRRKHDPEIENNGRRTIWELASNLHCSICGTCMSINEQRKMLKRLRIDDQNYRDYEIHAIFSNNLHRENKLSRMVNSYLNKKYRWEIERYATMEESQLMSIWQEKIKEGDICGLFWVMVTNRSISQEAANIVIGEVHMLSHLNGGICRHERMKLNQLSEERKKLKYRLHRSKIEAGKWAEELEAARVCINKLEMQVRQLQADAVSDAQSREYEKILDTLKTDNDVLRKRLNETDGRCRDYQGESRKFKKENEQLQSEVLLQKQTIVDLCREIKKLSVFKGRDDAGHERPAEQTRRGNLLLVGGNCGSNSHYRDLAQNLGWEYRHHSGCLGGGRQTLMDMLKWSDLILCSTDINSHGAVHCVKELAPKLNKEYCLLGNTSLSGIARVLAERSDSHSA